MATDWLNVLLTGGGALSSYLGADKAADAQRDAANAAIAAQNNQYNSVMAMNQHAMQTGNYARSTLAQILGLPGVDIPSPYLGTISGGGGGAPAQGGGGSGIAGALGTAAGTYLGGPIGGAVGGAIGGLFGGGRTKTKNRPIAAADAQKWMDIIRANPTAYDEPGEWGAFIASQRAGAQGQLDDLARSQQVGLYKSTAAPQVDTSNLMGMLEKYPGFQFAVDQARKSAGAMASATGSSPIAGNVLTGLTNNVSGNIAYPMWSDYLNRLGGLSGAGQVATGTVSGAAQNTGANISTLLGAQGDARASGILGKSGAITDLLKELGTQRAGMNSGVDYIIPGVNAPRLPAYR